VHADDGAGALVGAAVVVVAGLVAEVTGAATSLGDEADEADDVAVAAAAGAAGCRSCRTMTTKATISSTASNPAAVSRATRRDR
jgi:hypothetical protein